MVSLQDVQAARSRIGASVAYTPTIVPEALASQARCELRLKLECLQHTGSFKARGALNKLLQLTPEERARGVLAFSAGNHAQGVAWAAAHVGVAARIVMPKTTPLVKVTRTRDLGAEVERFGDTFAEAEARAREILGDDDLVFIHPFDDTEIIAGQGSVGLEILEQCPDADAIICPIGGGGLISGIAVAVKESQADVQIFGVQTETSPSMLASVQAGEVVAHATGPTLAEGIAVKTPALATLELVQRYVNRIELVGESEVERAMFDLLSSGRVLTEGAGAAPYAALVSGRFPELESRRVVIVLSGANVDLNILSRIIERAQVRIGRLARLEISVGDRPGALAGVLRLVGETEANVIKVQHERSFSQRDVWQVDIELVLETRDRQHVEEIVTYLRDAGYDSVRELAARPLQL